MRIRLQELESFETIGLTTSQRLNLKVLAWYLTNQLEGEKYFYHYYLFDINFGIQVFLPTFMTIYHPLKTKRDAENYVKRLVKFGTAFDQLLTAAKTREEKGFIPPAYIIQSVRDQCWKFSLLPPDKNLLYLHFCAEIPAISDLTEEERRTLCAAVANEIEKTVYPAYQKMMDYLDQLKPKAKSTMGGAWELPDGDAYYAYRLRSQTTTDLSPEEIHNLGLREVKRLTAEIAALKQKLQGTAAESYGGERLLEECRKINSKITAKLPEMFAAVPDTNVIFRLVPTYNQEFGIAHYRRLALDRSRPGIVYINPIPTSQYWVERFVYHESIPGHHLQYAFQYGADIPVLRKCLHFSGYSEGWAQYAVRLAREYTEPVNEMDRLNTLFSELDYAISLIVDTGINYKRWSLMDTYDFYASIGSALSMVSLSRYVVQPGQPCAYHLGELELLRLREKARTKLGEKFDLRDFHRVVLSQGAMPLSILAEEVDRYIEEHGK